MAEIKITIEQEGEETVNYTVPEGKLTQFRQVLRPGFGTGVIAPIFGAEALVITLGRPNSVCDALLEFADELFKGRDI